MANLGEMIKRSIEADENDSNEPAKKLKVNLSADEVIESLIAKDDADMAENDNLSEQELFKLSLRADRPNTFPKISLNLTKADFSPDAIQTIDTAVHDYIQDRHAHVQALCDTLYLVLMLVLQPRCEHESSLYLYVEFICSLLKTFKTNTPTAWNDVFKEFGSGHIKTVSRQKLLKDLEQLRSKQFSLTGVETTEKTKNDDCWPHQNVSELKSLFDMYFNLDKIFGNFTIPKQAVIERIYKKFLKGVGKTETTEGGANALAIRFKVPVIVLTARKMIDNEVLESHSTDCSELWALIQKSLDTSKTIPIYNSLHIAKLRGSRIAVSSDNEHSFSFLPSFDTVDHNMAIHFIEEVYLTPRGSSDKFQLRSYPKVISTTSKYKVTSIDFYNKNYEGSRCLM